MKPIIFLAAFYLLACQLLWTQNAAVIDKIIGLEYELAQSDSANMLLRVKVSNIDTIETIYLYKSPYGDSDYFVDDESINFDVSSMFISDPLIFPRYRMEMIPLAPGQSFWFHTYQEGHARKVEKIRFCFDIIRLSVIKERRLRREIVPYLEKWDQVLPLRVYYEYQLIYRTSLSWAWQVTRS